MMFDLVELIKNIPQILQYLVPGFLFLKIFLFFTSSKITESYMLMWSVVISYISIMVVRTIDDATFQDVCLTGAGQFIAPITASAVCSLACIWITKSIYFKNALMLINHKSFNQNLWDIMLDCDIGTNVIVTMNGQTDGYCGTLDYIEENGLESWFALSRYYRIDPRTREKIEVPQTMDVPTRLMLNLRDVQAVELFYSPDTKIFD